MRPSNRFLLVSIFITGCAVGLVVAVFWLILPKSNPTFAQAIPTAAPTPAFDSDSLFAPIDAYDRVISEVYQRVSPSVWYSPMA